MDGGPNSMADTFGKKLKNITRITFMLHLYKQSKEEGKDQESIKLCTTPEPGHRMRK